MSLDEQVSSIKESISSVISTLENDTIDRETASTAFSEHKKDLNELKNIFEDRDGDIRTKEIP